MYSNFKQYGKAVPTEKKIQLNQKFMENAQNLPKTIWEASKNIMVNNQ